MYMTQLTHVVDNTFFLLRFLVGLHTHCLFLVLLGLGVFRVYCMIILGGDELFSGVEWLRGILHGGYPV